MRKKPRKPLTKKQKVGLGVGIPLGIVVATALTFVTLHFASVSKNNATSVPGSNPCDHQIIQEIEDNNENGDNYRSDSDYEDSKPSDNTKNDEQIKNDNDYNVDTDSDDVIYKKVQQTSQKYRAPQNPVKNSYYDRYSKNQVKGVGGYNRNFNNGGRCR